MAEDNKVAIKRTEKRLQKLVDRYEIGKAVEEIGMAMQEASEATGAVSADVAAQADLPGGDVAVAVFSVVKKEDLEDQDDSDDEEEWAIVPEGFKRPEASSWLMCAEDIDRFRDMVSANFGFERDRIKPLTIQNAKYPLRMCTFECMGVSYEVRKRQISVIGKAAE